MKGKWVGWIDRLPSGGGRGQYTLAGEGQKNAEREYVPQKMGVSDILGDISEVTSDSSKAHNNPFHPQRKLCLWEGNDRNGFRFRDILTPLPNAYTFEEFSKDHICCQEMPSNVLK